MGTQLLATNSMFLAMLPAYFCLSEARMPGSSATPRGKQTQMLLCVQKQTYSNWYAKLCPLGETYESVKLAYADFR